MIVIGIGASLRASQRTGASQNFLGAGRVMVGLLLTGGFILKCKQHSAIYSLSRSRFQQLILG